MFLSEHNFCISGLMSCAGVAVLEAIEQDQLQQNAYELGMYLTHKLEALQKVHHLPLLLSLSAAFA